MLFSLGLGIDDDYYKIHGNNDASGNVIALLVDKVNHIFGKPFSWHAKCEVPFIMDFKIQIQMCLTIGFFIWIRFNYNLIYKYEKLFFTKLKLIRLVIVEISFQLYVKAPILDQPDLRIEFMVQGRSSTLTITISNKYLFYDLTSKTEIQHIFQ